MTTPKSKTRRGAGQEGEVLHQGLHRGGAPPHVRRLREERAAGPAGRHEPRQEQPQHECPRIQGGGGPTAFYTKNGIIMNVAWEMFIEELSELI